MNYELIPSTCNCGNHLLLHPGATCEICMGTVKEHPDQEPKASMFEVDYFEALELAISRAEIAA